MHKKWSAEQTRGKMTALETKRIIQSSFYRHLGEWVWEILLVLYLPGLITPSCMHKGTNLSLFIQISCLWLPSGGTFSVLFDFFPCNYKVQGTKDYPGKQKNWYSFCPDLSLWTLQMFNSYFPLDLAIRKHCIFECAQPASSHNPPFLFILNPPVSPNEPNVGFISYNLTVSYAHICFGCFKVSLESNRCFCNAINLIYMCNINSKALLGRVFFISLHSLSQCHQIYCRCPEDR